MSKRTVAGIVAGSIAVSAVTGNQTASDALDAIEITLAVIIVLAVAGLLALLVMRARRGPAWHVRGPERPASAGWTVVRVDMPARPERPATALPAAPRAITRGSAD